MSGVVHFVGFPLDFNGNLQRALYEAVHIAELGTEVDFAVSSEAIRNRTLAKSLPKRYWSSKNFKVCSLKPFVPSGVIGWRINNLLALPAGAFGLLNDKDVVMHVHAPTPVTKPFSLSFVGRLVKNPMVVDFHDPWSGHPFSKSPLVLLQTSMMKHVIRNADSIVVAHSALVDLIKRIDRDANVSIIPNGVDVDVFSPRTRNVTLARSLGMGSEDRVVLFSGHLTEEKGLDVFVRAARIVSEKDDCFKFIVVGDGPVRDSTVNMVSNLGLAQMFRFTGFVEASKLADYLSLADVCVCPYKPLAHYGVMRIETPMKVVQYLSMGKPVIMSRVSEENVVSWSGGGMLVDPGSPYALANAIVQLMDDEGSRRMMGKKGREYVERNLGWSQIAKKLVAIYRSLA